MPVLKREDEEFKMLEEWARRLTEEKRNASRRGADINVRRMSGLITQDVVREHLKNHDLNVSQNGVSISPSTRKDIHLLVLKQWVKQLDPEGRYSSDKVHVVLEIRNNAVAKIVEKTRTKLENIERLAKVPFRFAVVVLSENPSYLWSYTEENTENLFTCILREKTPKELYRIEEINAMLENRQMRKTGDWERLIAYLKG